MSNAILYCWNPCTLYIRAGKEVPATPCMVFSFILVGDDSLYRRITRCFDGAYQVLHADKAYPVTLYNDPGCKQPSNIHITDTWTGESADHSRAESTASTDSIGVTLLVPTEKKSKDLSLWEKWTDHSLS